MASSETVYTALIDIKTQQTQLKAELDRATHTLTSGLMNMQALASKLAPVLGIGGIVAFGKSVIDVADHIQDLSEQTGLSGKTLSGLKSTLEESGTSLDAFAKGIFTAQRNLGMINDDSDQAAVAIKALGLNLNELRTASPERFLELIANALGKIENPVQRNALGAQLLGRAFRELAPALSQVAGHLDELRRSGMSNEDVKRLADFNDSFTRFTNTIQILASGPLAAVVTLLQQLTGTLSAKDIAIGALNDISDQSLRLTEQIKQATEMRAKGVRSGIASDAVYNKMLEARNDLLQKSSDLTTKITQLGTPKKTGVTPFTPLPGKPGPKAPQDTRTEQLLREGLKDTIALIDEMQEAAVKGGQAIVDISETLDREGLTPLDEKLAEINKKFDEMRAKAAAAGEATGQDVGGLERRIEFFRRQQSLLASESVNALDTADAAEGERLRNQRQQFIELGKASADFQDRMREIAALSKVFGDSFDSASASIAATTGEIERLISIGLDPLDPKITELKGKLDDFQSSARAADSAESLIRGAAGGITATLHGVALGTQSVSDGFRNMAQNVLLSIADITFQLLVIEPLIKRVRDSLNAATSTGGGIGGFLSAFFGGSSGAITSAVGGTPTFSIAGAGGGFAAVPLLADGAIATRPTLAMIGDAGPEAVIPLPRKDLLGSNTPNVTVTINGDITPKQPNLTKDQIVQIGYEQFNERGLWMNAVEQRGRRSE